MYPRGQRDRKPLTSVSVASTCRKTQKDQSFQDAKIFLEIKPICAGMKFTEPMNLSVEIGGHPETTVMIEAGLDHRCVALSVAQEISMSYGA